jgi:hypothetical protein
MAAALRACAATGRRPVPDKPKEELEVTKNDMQRSWVLILALLAAASSAPGQRIPKPGFNLFSEQQDIEIGKEGAGEIEKKVKLVGNREVNEYVRNIGGKLASTPQAGAYPYSFKVVQDESINAFALPGGPVYIHSGLMLAAENEAQLAGVLAHEISHIALRHGTNQASKANLISLGTMLGGSLLGGGSISGQLAQLGIGFGANSVLLKYSRGAERDADILGARIMAQAGYNPVEMPRFFEKLEAETGKRSGVAEFFSSHPNPGNRIQRVENELQYFPQRAYDTDTGRLPRIQAILKGRPAPRVSQRPSRLPAAPAPAVRQPATAPAPPVIRPSERLRQYQGREFALSYPENWQALGNRNSPWATFAPDGGIVRTLDGGSAVGRGVITGFQSRAGNRKGDLERDTTEMIEQFRSGNPTMRASAGNSRSLLVDGQAALVTTLYADSPYAGETEIDLVLTVARPRGLYYMVFIAPQREYRQYQSAFETMLQSVRFPR